MTDHRKSFPTPGAVTHVISVCEITAHPVAVYFSVDPGGPYCAATSVCELGPKFVPEIEIAAPPYVVVPLAAIASPERPLIDGTIYFVVEEDAMDAWPSISTCHFKFAPTPATVLHVTVVCARDTVHPAVASYFLGSETGP